MSSTVILLQPFYKLGGQGRGGEQLTQPFRLKVKSGLIDLPQSDSI
jgi:hypothetical protein